MDIDPYQTSSRLRSVGLKLVAKKEDGQRILTMEVILYSISKQLSILSLKRSRWLPILQKQPSSSMTCQVILEALTYNSIFLDKSSDFSEDFTCVMNGSRPVKGQLKVGSKDAHMLLIRALPSPSTITRSASSNPTRNPMLKVPSPKHRHSYIPAIL